VYSEQIAKNFALIHSLEIPVSKEPTWLGDTLRLLEKSEADLYSEIFSFLVLKSLKEL
jgi:hypothetical protein